MPYKVYFVDNVFDSIETERRVLAEVGAELIDAQCKSEEEVAEVCRDADALLLVYVHLGQLAFSRLPNCRVVVRAGIGVDAIDLEAATAHGVCVANIPDYCIPEVSDHALALILACARRIVEYDRAVHAGVWAAMAPRIQGLPGQVLGLVGLGKIGQRLARNASALGLRVLATDPYVSREVAAACGAELVSLADLLAAADYVSIHCPLTAQTRHLIGSAQLRQMKPSAFLINTSRGPVVDEAALCEALQAGVIAGAALDVLETEPPAPTNPLLRMPNVIITPHAAYYSQRSSEEQHLRLGQEAARVLTGRYPRALVNPAVKQRLRELGRELSEE